MPERSAGLRLSGGPTCMHAGLAQLLPGYYYRIGNGVSLSEADPRGTDACCNADGRELGGCLYWGGGGARLVPPGSSG